MTTRNITAAIAAVVVDIQRQRPVQTKAVLASRTGLHTEKSLTSIKGAMAHGDSEPGPDASEQ